MDEIRIVSGTGGLGGGKVLAGPMAEVMERNPHFIACDAGTTDSGPFSLGSGRTNYPREAVKRDLGIILPMAREAGIPVLIGSAGTAGIDKQVDWMVDIADEIARENRMSIKTAAVYSEQSKDYLKGMLKSQRIRSLNPAPHLDEQVIEDTQHVVGMMGVEPLQEALDAGADLVVAGRCSDAALYAALPIAKGFPEGLAWHAGKVMECGTQVCVRAGRGNVFAAMTRDDFVLEVFGKDLEVTPQSVAAHSFYENGDPYIHHEASGHMDLSDCTYTRVEGGGVRVAGSRFHRGEDYCVKLEGAVRVGYQSVVIGGMRDPFFVRHLDIWLPEVREVIQTSVREIFALECGTDYHLTFHQYGQNAVMGEREPETSMPREVGLVLEVTAPTQELATKIADVCRQPLLHHPVPEWSGSITSIAYLHNPVPLERGAVYRFAYNHVALPETVGDMFRIRQLEIGG